MGINAQSGPDNGETQVGSAFSAMTEGPADLFKATAETGAPAARIRHPIPIFSVDLKRLWDEGVAAFDGARRKGWRYLVEHPGGVAVVDLAASGDRQPEMLGESDVADNLARSARKAQRIADADIDYEPRILDLNMIGDSVLWLHSARAPAHDVFISLSKTPTVLKPVALIERLRREAGRKVAAMAGAGREGGG
jgi:hypothetical protein